MANKIVRRFRILEYIGPEDWVFKTTENPNRYVNGLREIGKLKIREYLSEPEEVKET
jgi:hypothetical protein